MIFEMKWSLSNIGIWYNSIIKITQTNENKSLYGSSSKLCREELDVESVEDGRVNDSISARNWISLMADVCDNVGLGLGWISYGDRRKAGDFELHGCGSAVELLIKEYLGELRVLLVLS